MRKQSLEKFVKKFDTQVEAAKALGVHPSAISQALADIEANKRQVIVKFSDFRTVVSAESIRPFGRG